MRRPYTVYLNDEIPAEAVVVDFIQRSPQRRQDLLRNLLLKGVGVENMDVTILPPMQQPMKEEPVAAAPSAPQVTEEAPQREDRREEEPAKPEGKGRYSSIFTDSE
jgi:hypothetical protein